VPNLRRIGFVTNPGNPNSSPVLTNARNAAQQAGFIVVPVEAASLQEIESAFARLANERVEAIMTISDALFFSNRQRVAQLALRPRWAYMFVQREYGAGGGLLS